MGKRAVREKIKPRKTGEAGPKPVKSKKVGEENLIKKGIRFLKEVKIEAKKITWPGKREVFMTTLMVLFFSLFIGAYLGLLDIVYNAIISLLVR
jgi:preprotein translocase subunit SecE